MFLKEMIRKFSNLRPRNDFVFGNQLIFDFSVFSGYCTQSIDGKDEEKERRKEKEKKKKDDEKERRKEEEKIKKDDEKERKKRR